MVCISFRFGNGIVFDVLEMGIKMHLNNDAIVDLNLRVRIVGWVHLRQHITFSLWPMFRLQSSLQMRQVIESLVFYDSFKRLCNHMTHSCEKCSTREVFASLIRLSFSLALSLSHSYSYYLFNIYGFAPSSKLTKLSKRKSAMMRKVLLKCTWYNVCRIFIALEITFVVDFVGHRNGYSTLWRQSNHMPVLNST